MRARRAVLFVFEGLRAHYPQGLFRDMTFVYLGLSLQAMDIFFGRKKVLVQGNLPCTKLDSDLGKRYCWEFLE